MAGKKTVPADRNFEVSGELQGRKGKQKFSLSINAHNESYAAEKALCIIGSKHKKPRRKVLLTEIKEAQAKKK
ncbi:MAG: 50S ribosomal protein L18Ae [Candidatus ainarchaeum sp.]|nr:50S ribosomal protein L18Ae [Candidatus ainarchaeum sp.]